MLLSPEHSKFICLLSTTSVSVEMSGKTEVVGKNKLTYLVKIRVLAKQIRLFQEASAKIQYYSSKNRETTGKTSEYISLEAQNK